MKYQLQDLLVTLAGIITSALTAVLVLLLTNWTGYEIFSFMFWFIIPVGAICAGFAAASGYFFGCYFLNHRPSKGVFVNMLIVTAGAQLLVYYLQYATMKFDDGSA